MRLHGVVRFSARRATAAELEAEGFPPELPVAEGRDAGADAPSDSAAEDAAQTGVCSSRGVLPSQG
ncbi:unnamed protein product, partial [Ectocarpus sp. 4 AP-2014]